MVGVNLIKSDQTTKARMLRMLNRVYESTREHLALEVERHFTAEDLESALDELLAKRGAPCCVRHDHGRAFVVDAMFTWCEEVATTTFIVDPRLTLAERLDRIHRFATA